jgi:hypothetical protein
MHKLITSGIFLASVFVLAACNMPSSADPDVVNTSVAATRTAEAPMLATVPPATDTPLPADGSVSGKVCFPSEPPLPEMTLFFENTTTDEITSLPHTDGTGIYALNLPVGSYLAYAWRPGDTPIGGSYSQAVACGLTVSCTDHSLVPFEVLPGEETTDIDICDWYGQPGDVPVPPGVQLAPPPTATATPPPGGISFNCDGTYQRVRVADSGATGKTVSVDNWNGAAWVNVWNTSGGDPNLRQVTDDSGYYTFGECQKLLVVVFRYSNPQVTLELMIHKWNGAGLNQVYSNQGYYGEWVKIDNRVQFKEASKLGTVDNGPLGPCEWVTLEHTWDGNAFNQTGSNLEVIPNCVVTVP